jgi:hypothetical protein
MRTGFQGRWPTSNVRSTEAHGSGTTAFCGPGVIDPGIRTTTDFKDRISWWNAITLSVVRTTSTLCGVTRSETSDATRLPSITDVSIDSNDPSTCRWSFVRALMIVVDVKNSFVSLHPKLSREANY